MSGVRGSLMNGVCANSCHAKDSACATAWAAANANASLASCEAACRQCAQCRFASFSLAEGVCVWQERCKLLQLPGEDFRTLKLKRQRSRRQEAQRSSSGDPQAAQHGQSAPVAAAPLLCLLRVHLTACRPARATASGARASRLQAAVSPAFGHPGGALVGGSWRLHWWRTLPALQHGQSATPLAVPQLGSCASSGRVWRL